MYHSDDTNPHFHPGDPVIEFDPRSPPSRPRLHPPRRTSTERVRFDIPQTGRRSNERVHFETPPNQPQPQYPTHNFPESNPNFTLQPPPKSPIPHSSGRPKSPVSHSTGRSRSSVQQQQTSLLHAPKSRRTKPVAWLVAAFCALFWIIVIVGGLIVLIVYLVFQPRYPRFDLSSATFNAAYLDMGYLLNADITLLLNFTNPNTKVNVDFNFIAIDLYYQRIFVATRYIDPISVMSRSSMFLNVELIASQVRLPSGIPTELQREVGNGRVTFEIRGVVKTRSRLGGIFQYSYWLYPQCQFEVTSPPSGVLIRKHCVTNR